MSNLNSTPENPVFTHKYEPSGIVFSCSDIYLKNEVVVSVESDDDICSETLLNSIQSFIVSHQLMYSNSPASNIDYSAVEYLFY